MGSRYPRITHSTYSKCQCNFLQETFRERGLQWDVAKVVLTFYISA